MEPTDSFTLAQLLAIGALIGATCEYAEMVSDALPGAEWIARPPRLLCDSA